MAQFYTEDRVFYILGIDPKEIILNADMFGEGEIEIAVSRSDGVIERRKHTRKRPFAWDVNVEAQKKPPHMRQQQNDLMIQLAQMTGVAFPVYAQSPDGL
jgi:hypothetical protein